MITEQAEDVAVVDVTLWCPECGDQCEQRPPVLWMGPEGSRPAQRHMIDASPLCAVVGPDGYRPAVADVREITAERPE